MKKNEMTTATNTYLPGNIQDRIQDLMKQYKITQVELAEKIMRFMNWDYP